MGRVNNFYRCHFTIETQGMYVISMVMKHWKWYYGITCLRIAGIFSTLPERLFNVP